MAELTAKGATSTSKVAIEKRVLTLESRLERIDTRVKRGDPAKAFTAEKEMREAELKYLKLKLAML